MHAYELDTGLSHRLVGVRGDYRDALLTIAFAHNNMLVRTSHRSQNEPRIGGRDVVKIALRI